MSIMFYYLKLNFIILYYILLYYIILYYIALHYIILFFDIFVFFMILYHIILFFTDVHMQYTFINNITHTHIYIYSMLFVFFRNIQGASRREPPAPRELGREERSRRLTKADWGQAWLPLAP